LADKWAADPQHCKPLTLQVLALNYVLAKIDDLKIFWEEICALTSIASALPAFWFRENGLNPLF